MSTSSTVRPLGLTRWSVALVLVAAAAVSLYGLRRHSATTRTATVLSKAALNGAQASRIRETFNAMPLAFESNQGQTDSQVKYVARGNGYTVFLTSDETVFDLHSSSGSPATSRANRNPAAQASSAHDSSSAIRLRLAGGNRQAQIAATDPLPGRSNYFIGSDASKWQKNVPQFARVSYSDVYPGVNLAYYGAQHQLEFDFVVAPHADPTPIRLAVAGADRIATDASGNLILSSTAGDVTLHKPVAYQQNNGNREAVAASFVLSANHQVGIALGNYDRSRELVIDPAVTYATYLGGLAEDDANAVTNDTSGHAYVTGQTKSLNFPTTTGSQSTSNAGGFDVFVTKLSPDGSTLVYSTYVGGSGDDSGNGIVLDSGGNAFVAGGTTSTDFPHTAGAYQTSPGGGGLDAFVFELSSNGGSLTYSTYLGGSNVDLAQGIALATDGSGDVFVVGSTYSSNFPTHTPTVQSSLVGASNGFVTKLNSTGSALVYSTYLGGGTGDLATAVAVDSANQAYVTGATQNAGFPHTTGAFQTSCGTDGTCNGGLDDAFVTVFKADGSGFVYSTFFGGEAPDQGFGIAVDSSHDAYITGATASTAHFPLKSAIQGTYGGGAEDAFVAELNPTGSNLLYSTYLGGELNDTATGIAIDGGNNVYVTGQTGSTKFPLSNATQATLGGANDAFITEVNAAGSQFVFSTYLGGTLNENSTVSGGNVGAIGAISVDAAGANLFVAGNTASTDFPTHSPLSGHSANAGGTDAFVAKYNLNAASPSFTVSNGALSTTSGPPGTSATATITITSTGGFNSAVTVGCSVTPAVSKGPTCSVTGSPVTPPANGSGTATINVTTVAASAALSRPDRSNGVFFATLLPIAGLALLGAGFGTRGQQRRKLLGFLVLGLLLAGLMILPACGGGSSSSGGGGNTGTPAGAYTINVTGTSGATVVNGLPAPTLTIN